VHVQVVDALCARLAVGRVRVSVRVRVRVRVRARVRARFRVRVRVRVCAPALPLLTTSR